MSPPRKMTTTRTRRTSEQAGRSEGIQSVRRALMILELFSDSRPALSMSEIAGLTGLNRATCYRFCQTLLKLGYLEEVDERRLRPGLKAISLAHSALRSRELPELAMPYLRELRRKTDETVNMALLDGTDVVYIARVDERPPRLATAVRRQPAARLCLFTRAGDPRVPARGRGRRRHRQQRPEAHHREHDRRASSPQGRAGTDTRAGIRRQRSGDRDGPAGSGGADSRGVRATDRGSEHVVTRPLKTPTEIEDVLAPEVVETASSISALASQLTIMSVIDAPDERTASRGSR